MLTSAGGCDLAVERGPDWLLVRLRNLDFLAPDAPPLAEQLWSLLQQHFTYRLVLELDDVQPQWPPDRTVGATVSTDRRARRRTAAVRLVAG